MRPVMVLWIAAGGGAAFAAAVPLAWVGRRNRALGYSNAIDVVLVEGFGELGDRAAAELRELGFVLHDAGALHRVHARRHPGLERFGAFLRNCFLRWLVLEEFFAGEPVLHLDGDVVFNECPATLARMFAGRTFVLQGCPALTAISDRGWYRQYAMELAAYERDVEAYSAQARAVRAGWEESFHLRWAGEWNGRLIASDQDLLSHLLHTGRLRQADPAAVAASVPDHVFFENPLIIGDLVPGRGLTYERRKSVDYLAGRRVGFWHMQTDWCRYLAKQMLRERLGPLAATGRLSFGQKDAETLVGAVLRRLGGRRHFARPEIYRRFFTEGDFARVFAGERWWEPDVFGPPV